MGLQKYHDTYFSRNGFNQMLILKISKDLPETLRRFFFFSLSLPRLLPDLTVFMSNTDGTL
jgi:hypothetical protein